MQENIQAGVQERDQAGEQKSDLADEQTKDIEANYEDFPEERIQVDILQ